MLNDYHLQFLRKFTNDGVRFVIIGGMARWHYEGRQTRDLDILVDIGEGIVATERALVEWSKAHPAHTFLPLEYPIGLRPMIQIKFPDAACLFADEADEHREIRPEDGIDVLTSVAGAEFEEIFSRRVIAERQGLKLPFACEDDLAATSKPKQRS